MSWQYGDSHFLFPQLFDPDVDKFALFGGSKSIASNKDGFANFTNLTILGSTHKNVYIIFIPEGNQIIVPLVKATFPNLFVGLNKFQHFILPIKLQYINIHDINIIQALPNQFVEGNIISPLPALKLIDKNSKLPLPGFLCFALLKSFANLNFTIGFQPMKFKQKEKSILGGIT